MEAIDGSTVGPDPNSPPSDPPVLTFGQQMIQMIIDNQTALL